MRRERFLGSLRERFSQGTTHPALENLTLEEIGGMASSSPSLDELGDRLAQQVHALVPFDRMIIAFVDLEGRTHTEAYVAGLGVPGRQRGDARPLAGTVVEAATSNRSGVLVGYESPDVLASRFPGLKSALDAGIRSVIAVPLVSRDSVVAALVVASVDPEAYSERHLELARRIGALIAGSVAIFRPDTESTRNGQEREALLEIGRVAGSSPDIPRVYEQLAQIIRTLIPFDRLVIALLDSEADGGTNACVSGIEIPGWEVGRTFAIRGTPTETVVRTRSGVVEGTESPDALTARYPSEAPSVAVGFKSLIVAPLVFDGQVFATLTFKSTRPGAFTEGDLALAERIAGQLAGPVAGYQLDSRLRGETEAGIGLAELGRLMDSTTSLDQVYERLAEAARPVVPSDTFVIAMLDLEAHKAVNSWASGNEVPGWGVGTTYEIDARTLQALTGDRSGIVAAVDSAEELAARFSQWDFITSGGFCSLVAAPLVSNDQVFGMLMLCSTKAGAYTERDLALVRRIGSQIAGSIASAQLRERLRGEEDDAEVLGGIGRTIASARAIDDVYDSLVAQLRTLIPFDRIEIATLDLSDRILTRTYVFGVELPGDDEAMALPLPGTIADEAVRRRAPVLFHAPASGEEEARFPSLTPSIETGLRTFMAAPLIGNDDIVGLMTISSTTMDAYTERDLTLAERAGFQIGGAIANARLQRERERLRQ